MSLTAKTYLHTGGSQGGDLLLHSVRDTSVHGGSTRHDNVTVKVLPDVKITLHDRVVGSLVDTVGFESEEGGLEEGFRSSESAKLGIV